MQWFKLFQFIKKNPFAPVCCLLDSVFPAILPKKDHKDKALEFQSLLIIRDMQEQWGFMDPGLLWESLGI